MKRLFSILIAAMFLISCGNTPKESGPTTEAKMPESEKEKPKVERMLATELAKKHGITLEFLDYSEGNEMAKGKGNSNKPKAEKVTLSVFTDLTLTYDGTTFTTTISPNAEWGGVQKFFTIDTTNNGVSVCNWSWFNVVGPATKTCASNGPGSYRSWTSDKTTYDVHLSVFVPVE